MDLRKKLYDTYGDKIEAKTKPYTTLAQNLGVRKQFHVNAIKLKKMKSGWKVEEMGLCNLPTVASKLFLSDLGDYGVKKICHPDLGKIMIIEGNNEDGFSRRYETAKWFDGKALLLKKEVVNEEELAEAMVQLEDQQGEYSAKGIKEFLKRIKENSNFKKLVSKLESMEDKDEDFSDDDEDLDMETDDSDDDTLEDDGMEDDSDDELEDDDDDMEEDDDLDDELEDDDELDDDLDDDLEEEDEIDVEALKKEYNAKIKKYKTKKTNTLKKELLELKKVIKENS